METTTMLFSVALLFVIYKAEGRAENNTTPSLPVNGQYQAVVIAVSGMSSSQFLESKKLNFTTAVLNEVAYFCGKGGAGCGPAVVSRKRRAVTTFDSVSLVPGYPVEEPGRLRVAFFVTSSSGAILSKDTLLIVVTRASANLTTILGRVILGIGRLHITVQTYPTSTTNTKWNLLTAQFFGIFFGVVLLTIVCLGVICWCGRKADRVDDVRPLTTSVLQLVEKPATSRQVQT